MKNRGDIPPLRVIDLLSHGFSHLAINRFWLGALADRFRITLLAESSHIAALKVPGITPIPVRRGQFWKFWREVRFLAALIQSGKTPVLIMGATGAQLLVLAVFERLMPRRARAWVVVLHSEVEGVVDPSDLNRKLAGFTLRRLRFPRRAQAIVLGRHILENLAGMNLASSRFHAIEHPLPDARRIAAPPPDRDVAFAVTGVLRTDTKDLNTAGQLAGTTRARVGFFGRRGREFKSVPGVSEHLTDRHFSERWMQQNLCNSDFLLLCPARQSYRFTALGSLGDALTYGLPIAWLEHDALKAAETAPFGVTASDVAALAERARSFKPPKPEQVEHWVNARNQTGKRAFLSVMTSR